MGNQSDNMESKLISTPQFIEQKEREIALPKLEIRPKNPTEEFDYLWYVLGRVPFYKKQGYTFETPDHPEFQRLVATSPNFTEEDKTKAQRLFVDQIYNPAFYANGLAVLEGERTRIEQAFPGFVEFNKKWGFKLFPKYQVTLTRFGPGGLYDDDIGLITMMTRQDGTFKRPNPSHTPVHEMVHIGIENDIVKQYHLTHREKERLVDLVTSSRFGGILPGYKLQDLGDPKIDPYITPSALEDLPSAVSRYVQDYPRE